MGNVKWNDIAVTFVSLHSTSYKCIIHRPLASTVLTSALLLVHLHKLLFTSLPSVSLSVSRCTNLFILEDIVKINIIVRDEWNIRHPFKETILLDQPIHVTAVISLFTARSTCSCIYKRLQLVCFQWRDDVRLLLMQVSCAFFLCGGGRSLFR